MRIISKLYANILIILIISGLILPNFAFLQDQSISPPETLEEAKELGEEAVEISQEKLPGTLEKIWQEEVLPTWRKMYDWFEKNIWPKILCWFKREIKPKVKEEIEKRKPVIEEEFQKEKEEVKKEIREEVIPKATQSLWEKFKELIK